MTEGRFGPTVWAAIWKATDEFFERSSAVHPAPAIRAPTAAEAISGIGAP